MSIDVPQFTIAKELVREDIFLCLARVPGTEQLFTGSSDGNVYAVDCAAEKLQTFAMPGHTSYVTGLALAGEQLISGSYDGHLIWWNAKSRAQLRKFKAHDRWIRDVVVSPDGKVVATVGDDMVCRLWDAESAKLRHELRGHEAMTPTQFSSMLYTCTFTADGQLLATADRVGHLVIWEVASGKQVATVEAPGLYTWDGKQRIRSIGGVRALAFSPDGKVLAAGGIDQVANVDGLSTKARVDLFRWEKKEGAGSYKTDKNGMIEFLAYHPKGDWLLASGGGDKGIIAFIDPREKNLVAEHEAAMYIHKIILEADGKRMFAAGHKRFALFTATAKPAPAKSEKLK